MEIVPQRWEIAIFRFSNATGYDLVLLSDKKREMTSKTHLVISKIRINYIRLCVKGGRERGG